MFAHGPKEGVKNFFRFEDLGGQRCWIIAKETKAFCQAALLMQFTQRTKSGFFATVYFATFQALKSETMRMNTLKEPMTGFVSRPKFARAMRAK